MKINAVFILVLVLILFSCRKDEIKIDPNNPLIGTWNFFGNQDNISIYSRSSEFIDNYGYLFRADGTLLQREITGWCATPPVSYSDYDGIWKQVNDTLIEINVGYWGGLLKYQLDIESVDKTSLKVINIPEDK
jgi:hypothetical protein